MLQLKCWDVVFNTCSFLYVLIPACHIFYCTHNFEILYLQKFNANYAAGTIHWILRESAMRCSTSLNTSHVAPFYAINVNSYPRTYPYEDYNSKRGTNLWIIYHYMPVLLYETVYHLLYSNLRFQSIQSIDTKHLTNIELLLRNHTTNDIALHRVKN